MKFLAFGEVMLRIAPAGQARFRQAMPGMVESSFTGAEANVCASLAMYGAESRLITALPRTPVTEALAASLRGVGIDLSPVLWRSSGRLGVYFVETGANQRGSAVLYDRDHSAICLAAPDEYEFDAALAGVGWLHLTGITPALSESAFQATLLLARRARERGVEVSCDLNFRNKLWKWRPGVAARQLAGDCMAQILPFVSLVVANEEDAADVLGIHAKDTQVERGQIDAQAYRDVARQIVERFPSVRLVAFTLRESISADHNNWGGMLYEAASGECHFAPLDEKGKYRPYEIRDIVDRVGAGDSFTAGLLYALHAAEYQTPAKALPFAVAASCLKHSIRGDFNYVTKEEVAALVGGQASGRVRR